MSPIQYSNLLQCDGDGKFFRSWLRVHECKGTRCTLQPFAITKNDGYFVWNIQHWKRFCYSDSFDTSIQIVYSEKVVRYKLVRVAAVKTPSPLP